MQSSNLDKVKHAFQQWRSQRGSTAEPIPETLWAKALNLFPQYKRSTICRELRLSGGQFKQRLAQLQQNSATNTGFVLATNTHKPVIPATSTDVQISIYGTRTVTISAGVHDIAHIMPHIGNLL